MLKAIAGTEKLENDLPPGVASPVLTTAESDPAIARKYAAAAGERAEKGHGAAADRWDRGRELNVSPDGVESPFLAIVVSGPPAPVKIPSWLPYRPRNATVAPLRA